VVITVVITVDITVAIKRDITVDMDIPIMDMLEVTAETMDTGTDRG
jgi:hypothetical protein